LVAESLIGCGFALFFGVTQTLAKVGRRQARCESVGIAGGCTGQDF